MIRSGEFEMILSTTCASCCCRPAPAAAHGPRWRPWNHCACSATTYPPLPTPIRICTRPTPQALAVVSALGYTLPTRLPLPAAV